MEPNLGELEKGSNASGQIQDKAHSEDYERNINNNASDTQSRRRSPSPSGSDKASRVSSAGTIGIKKPGPWVLHHHKQNLITEIRRPVEFNSAFDKVGFYLRKRFGDSLRWAGRKLANRGDKNQNEEKGKESDRAWEERRFRMSFAELQRMKLRKLQIKLVGNIVDMHYSNCEDEEWEVTLRKYGMHYVLQQIHAADADINLKIVQALQDYDYMRTRSKEPTDPFLVTGERWIDHRILQRAMGNFHDYFVAENFEIDNSIGPWMENEDGVPIGGTRNEKIKETEWKNFIKRLQMAVLGGVFLLVPMWLMVLHQTRYTALISTTVFVAIFGLVMARYLEKEMEVLSVTAAYAAVLVVFVGLNT
jgi:hypothetical protein